MGLTRQWGTAARGALHQWRVAPCVASQRRIAYRTTPRVIAHRRRRGGSAPHPLHSTARAAGPDRAVSRSFKTSALHLWLVQVNILANDSEKLMMGMF